MAHFHRVSKGYAPFSIDRGSGETIVLAKSNEEGPEGVRYAKGINARCPVVSYVTSYHTPLGHGLLPPTSHFLRGVINNEHAGGYRKWVENAARKGTY